jgi:chitinase
MLIETYGFDGVDLDMEPIRETDRLNYQRFVEELTQELDQTLTKRGARPQLTAAVNGQFSLFAQLQDYFDQINLMTYDLSGPWSGWQAWHNSPLYSDGILFESTGEQKPSVDLWIDLALEAGIRPEKLGLGIDFYGYVWNGVSEPGEGWFFLSPPTLRDERGGTPFRKLDREFNLRTARWDSVARVPYLSLYNPPQFVSFDNERSIEEKVRYAAERGLGGVMVWELSAGYVQNQLRGNVHPLLRAVHKANTKYRPPLRTQD